MSKTKRPGLLADLRNLQDQIAARLAEQEAEFRGLSQADTRLDALQEELGGLHTVPWKAERQALTDQLQAMSRAST